jgi:predicted nuclease with TOPRIM domain
MMHPVAFPTDLATANDWIEELRADNERQAARMKTLDDENERLKRQYAELSNELTAFMVLNARLRAALQYVLPALRGNDLPAEQEHVERARARRASEGIGR